MIPNIHSAMHHPVHSSRRAAVYTQLPHRNQHLRPGCHHHAAAAACRHAVRPAAAALRSCAGLQHASRCWRWGRSACQWGPYLYRGKDAAQAALCLLAAECCNVYCTHAAEAGRQHEDYCPGGGCCAGTCVSFTAGQQQPAGAAARWGLLAGVSDA
jgi:hypothetical protein